MHLLLGEKGVGLGRDQISVQTRHDLSEEFELADEELLQNIVLVVQQLK
jgi:hypothetical protein